MRGAERFYGFLSPTLDLSTLSEIRQLEWYWEPWYQARKPPTRVSVTEKQNHKEDGTSTVTAPEEEVESGQEDKKGNTRAQPRHTPGHRDPSRVVATLDRLPNSNQLPSHLFCRNNTTESKCYDNDNQSQDVVGFLEVRLN